MKIGYRNRSCTIASESIGCNKFLTLKFLSKMLSTGMSPSGISFIIRKEMRGVVAPSCALTKLIRKPFTVFNHGARGDNMQISLTPTMPSEKED